MGDEQEGAAPVGQEGLQPVDALDVQMVGGLVEQQQVGVPDQGAGQQHAALASAREGVEFGIRVQIEPRQHRFHPLLQCPGARRLEIVLDAGQALQVLIGRLGAHLGAGLVVLPDEPAELVQAVGHDVEDAAGHTDRHLLVQARDDHALPHLDLAVIRRQLARDHLHQSGLALAVAAEQADALALVDGEIQGLEQGCAAEGQGDVLSTVVATWKTDGVNFRTRTRNADVALYFAPASNA